MKVYLVYGLELNDLCEEPFVKKVFKDKEKALEYLNKEAAVFPSDNTNWFVVEIELE
jgi:hypothetical protein